jgi:adenosylcobyric acid synthase
VLGICGGMQMLGHMIEDNGVEGKSVHGLGLLPLSTRMGEEKILRQVNGMACYPSTCKVTGYEIHHGVSDADAGLFPFAKCSQDQQIWGTYVHGLFEQGDFRKAWLKCMGVASHGQNQATQTLASLDKLADALEKEISPELLAAFFDVNI